MRKEMRLAVGQFQNLDEETAKFAKQLGVESVQFNTPNISGEVTWQYNELLNLKNKCNKLGLILESIENVPLHFYDLVILGKAGREEQIENYKNIIKNMGKIGIPLLGHHFVPTFVWRTSLNGEGRGGAKVTEFDMDIAQKGINVLLQENKVNQESSGATMCGLAKGASNHLDYISKEELWSNYEYFMKAVLPIAEEYGVKLILHPDDPPVKNLGGIDRFITSPDDYKKAMEITDSDAWGVNLCLGCCSQMEQGENAVKELIQYFGQRNKIYCIHFRDVKGSGLKFKECFLGEGNFDPAEIMLELKKVNYKGIIMVDHVPQIVNDTPWGHRGRAYEIGYIQGLMKMMG